MSEKGRNQVTKEGLKKLEEKLAPVSGLHDLYFVFNGNMEVLSWKFE